MRVLRGAVHARAGAQPHQRLGDRRSRASWPDRATPKSSCWGRTSTATAIHRARGLGFREACSTGSGASPGIRRVRFTTSHPRDFVKEIIDAIDENPALCNHVHLPVQSGSTRVLDAMQRLYTREEYMQRIDWMKAARRPIAITTDIIVGFPGETEADFEATLALLDRGRIRFDLQLQVFAAAQHRRAGAGGSDSRRRERPGVWRSSRSGSARFRSARNAAYVGARRRMPGGGIQQATGQWIGRTSQHKTLNFLLPAASDDSDRGSMWMCG